MIIGVILAAGKGTRIKSTDRNKVTFPFLNKPLIIYSVELMKPVCDKTVVVVGAFAESVKQILKNYPVVYAYQEKQRGTADATKVGLSKIAQLKLTPDQVLVGYGDHTMFYKKETIEKLIESHMVNTALVSLITFDCNDPDKLKYGRIVRDSNNEVVDIVEHKDATAKQRLIKEVNPGFYCFNYQFIKENVGEINKSSVSGEYYITDLIKIAASKHLKINSLKVDFKEVGLGVNTSEELLESEKIYLQKF